MERIESTSQSQSRDCEPSPPTSPSSRKYPLETSLSPQSASTPTNVTFNVHHSQSHHHYPNIHYVSNQSSYPNSNYQITMRTEK